MGWAKPADREASDGVPTIPSGVPERRWWARRKRAFAHPTEVVTDGETGFLSEVGDVDKMANDAARLLTDEEFRRQMGRRARESAISRYRTDIVIPKYIDFYEKIKANPKDAAALNGQVLV